MRGIRIRFLLIILLLIASNISRSQESTIVNQDDQVSMCRTEILDASNATEADMSHQIKDFFSLLFSTESWPPRWYCGEWSPFHGWFYITSDFLIWLSYFTIPGILFFFLFKRRENLPFRWIFIFFIGFILLCGLTHLMDALIFWWPAYRLSALVRFGTAIVSMGTVFALVKTIPKAMELKSPELLEKMVQERTKALSDLNSKYEKEILDRKKAEKEVLRLNKVLTNFRQAISNSSIISITDKKGIISYVNENFVKISGYHEDELIGQNHRIINSLHHSKEFWQEMWRSIAQGKTWRAEVKNKNKNGSFYWVDTYIMPFTDENDQVNQFLSIRNDITERKNAEEELKQLNNTLERRVEEKTRDIRSINDKLTKINELFESVQSHAQIGVWEYGFKEKDLYFSKESNRILGIQDQHKLSFTSIIRLTHIQHRRLIYESISKCIAFGQPYDIELLISINPDTELWIRATGIPVYMNDQICGIKGMIQNIENVKRNEMALNASKSHLTELIDELESFTYSVSHDLRAPLRYIHGHAKILEEDFSDKLDTPGIEMLQVIMKNVQKMGQLIDDLLDFSRLGRKEMIRDNCNMMRIVEHILKEYLTYYERNDVNIDLKDLHPAKADFDMIKQVWVNLISNAFKYSHKSQKIFIDIGSYKDDNEVCYFIRDKGVGFDPAYMHKLFGVFQRLHKVEEFQGTGVGLAIAHRIITRHKGRIWAESELGKGAIFYFTLPN